MADLPVLAASDPGHARRTMVQRGPGPPQGDAWPAGRFVTCETARPAPWCAEFASEHEGADGGRPPITPLLGVALRSGRGAALLLNGPPDRHFVSFWGAGRLGLTPIDRFKTKVVETKRKSAASLLRPSRVPKGEEHRVVVI